MLRGEIWWTRIPLLGSSGKSRPMLIVSDDVFNRNERYSKVMAVHVTSVRRPHGPYDWEVSLPKGTAGLERSSVAKCAEIYTVRKETLRGPAGTMPRALMAEIDRALAIALSLPLPL